MAGTAAQDTEQLQPPELATNQERRRRRIARRPRNHILVTGHALEASGSDLEDLTLAKLRATII